MLWEIGIWSVTGGAEDRSRIMRRFDGKVALVTGSGSGWGRR